MSSSKKLTTFRHFAITAVLFWLVILNKVRVDTMVHVRFMYITYIQNEFENSQPLKSGHQCAICKINVHTNCIKSLGSCIQDSKEPYGRIIVKLDYFSQNGQQLVQIDVLGCENLPAMDVGGTSDPYCVLRIDPQPKKSKWKKKTKVITKNLNPVFKNETFTLNLTNLMIRDLTSRVTIDVFDHDTIS